MAKVIKSSKRTTLSYKKDSTTTFFFVADVDECQAGGKNVCSPLERCINTAGGYKCDNQTAAACKLGEQELDGRCIGG